MKLKVTRFKSEDDTALTNGTHLRETLSKL